MSAQRFCEKCWTPVEDASATSCLLCGSGSFVEVGRAAATEPLRDRIGENFAPSVENPAGTAGAWPKVIKTVAVVISLALIGWLLWGAFGSARLSADDFTGEWIVTNREALANLGLVAANSEPRFRMWRERDVIANDIPLAGQVYFTSQAEGNTVRGNFLIAGSDDTRPVVATLSRDKKSLSIYFRLQETSTRPDIILHAQRR